MADSVTIVVAHALPRNDGSQSLWLSSSNSPLSASIVTDTQKSDFARRPFLLSTPLNNIKESFAGTAGHGIKKTWTLACASLVGSHDDVTLARPEGRIRCLPSRVCGLHLGVDLFPALLVERAIRNVLPVCSCQSVDRKSSSRLHLHGP